MIRSEAAIKNEISIVKHPKLDMKTLVSDIHNYQIYVNQQDSLGIDDRKKFEQLHRELALIDDESIKMGVQMLSEERKNGKFKQINASKDDNKVSSNKNRSNKDGDNIPPAPVKKRGRKPKCANIGSSSSESASVSTKFLDKYNLPDNVKVTTARLFSLYSQGEVKKVSKRKSTLFMAIKEAYKEHGITIPPDNIRIMLNMDKKEMSRAKTLYSYPRTGIKSTQIDNSPIDYIPTYCEDLKVPDDVRELIIELGNVIMNLDEELYDSKPQNVAAGIIAYGLMLYGMSIENKIIADTAQISMATLNSSLDHIKIVHAEE